MSEAVDYLSTSMEEINLANAAASEADPVKVLMVSRGRRTGPVERTHAVFLQQRTDLRPPSPAASDR